MGGYRYRVDALAREARGWIELGGDPPKKRLTEVRLKPDTIDYRK